MLLISLFITFLLEFFFTPTEDYLQKYGERLTGWFYGKFDTGQNPKAYVGYEVFEKNKFYVVYQRMVGEDKIIDEQIYISTDEFDALLGEFYNKAEEQLETGPKEN